MAATYFIYLLFISGMCCYVQGWVGQQYISCFFLFFGSWGFSTMGRQGNTQSWQLCHGIPIQVVWGAPHASWAAQKECFGFLGGCVSFV